MVRFGSDGAPESPAAAISSSCPVSARGTGADKMRTLETVAELRHALDPSRSRAKIGLVPTMGALHDGHRALFHAAREECAVVVASIFLNPAQFADPRDLNAYPTDLSADLRVAEASGVDLVFAP